MHRDSFLACANIKIMTFSEILNKMDYSFFRPSSNEILSYPYLLLQMNEILVCSSDDDLDRHC